MDTSNADRIYRIHLLLETLYPITVAAALLLGGVLPGLTVLQRRAHGNNGASYLPIGVDAAVGNSELNFRFRNDYAFPLRIHATSQDGALTIAIYRAE